MGGSSTKCGHGTTKSDGVCQVNDTVCGSNTQWEDATSTCIGAAQQEYCGPGTILKNGQCATIGILNPPACNYNGDCEQFLGLKPCNSSSSKECTFCPGLGKTCSIYKPYL